MDLNVMIGGVLQQKRALDRLVESREGKPRSEAILHLRTRDTLLSVYAAKKNRANIGVRQVIIPAAYPPCQLMSRKITGGPNPFKNLALETYIIMNGSAFGYEK